MFVTIQVITADILKWSKLEATVVCFLIWIKLSTELVRWGNRSCRDRSGDFAWETVLCFSCGAVVCGWRCWREWARHCRSLCLEVLSSSNLTARAAVPLASERKECGGLWVIGCYGLNARVCSHSIGQSLVTWHFLNPRGCWDMH